MGWGESEYAVVGESKILTVSYGTFSCTLEGFDEPFSTMKAIAEYFRDLAADDRYFGAEPPQPDTEMLHKIAERTIQRRVAAELAENGVILRQETPAEKAAPVAPALAVEVAKADAAVQETPAPTASVMDAVSDVPPAPQRTPVRAIAIAAPADNMTAPSQGGGDTVAEKLQRIRAVVAREAAAPAPYSEDQHAEDFGSNSFEDEAPKASALFDTPIDAGYGDFDDEIEDAVEEMAAEPAVMAEDAALDELEAPIQETAKEAIAEIEVEASVAEELSTDITEDVATDAAAEVEALADTPEAMVEEAEAAVSDAKEAENEAKADDTPTALSEADAIDAALSEDEAAAQVQSPLRTKPRRRIVVQKISRSEMEAAQAAKDSELPPELEAELMAELAEVEAEVEAIDVAPEMDVKDEVEATEDDADAMLARLAADVPVEAPVEDVAEPVETEAESQAFNRDDDVLSKLLNDSSIEAEEEPEVAEAEAKIEAVETEEAVANEVEAEDTAAKDATAAEADTDEAELAEDDANAPSRKSFAAEAEDDAIERLMSTTSSRLDNDESSVRRASIAHLKAAVAATKADASIAEANEKRDEEELGQYREDLARVVRPQRPTSSGGRVERPAPLVLVSEQRIDRPEEPSEAIAASIDVRPRRVTRGNLAMQEEMEEQFDEDVDANLFSDDETKISFPEYAANAGALELPDLLEAAAAHYVVVEGAEHFTRPMLMRKLAIISGPEAPSREDGLRAFGTLLRTGKIVKTDNGKFVLSKSSQFA